MNSLQKRFELFAKRTTNLGIYRALSLLENGFSVKNLIQIRIGKDSDLPNISKIYKLK